LGRERPSGAIRLQESIADRRKVVGLNRAVDQPRGGAVSQMRNIGFKALTAVVTIGRHSKKHIDWTLAITIFSTLVTLSLIALYILQDSGDF
jgi:hypothetical protein